MDNVIFFWIVIIKMVDGNNVVTEVGIGILFGYWSEYSVVWLLCEFGYVWKLALLYDLAIFFLGKDLLDRI